MKNIYDKLCDYILRHNLIITIIIAILFFVVVLLCQLIAGNNSLDRAVQQLLSVFLASVAITQSCIVAFCAPFLASDDRLGPYGNQVVFPMILGALITLGSTVHTLLANTP